MNEEDDEFYEGTDEESATIKTLRNRLKTADQRAADKAAGEVTGLKRENVLLTSGIDFDSPNGQMFRELYTGPPEADAVREAAQKYGLIAAAPLSGASEADVAAAQRIAQASSGADIASSGTVTPATFVSWPKDKQQHFKTTYPDAYKRVRNGEEVSGLPV